MWHITPILCAISSDIGCSVGIAEDESKHVSAIDHGFEVIDLRLVRRIPRAVEVFSAALLQAWEFGCPEEGKMSQIYYQP